MIVIRVLLLELSCKDLPNDLEQTQLQPIASFGAYAQVGEDEEPGVLVRVLGIFEVVQRRDHGARRTPRLAVLLHISVSTVVNTHTTAMTKNSKQSVQT